MNNKKGSVLILTLIAVLVLSILVSGLLTIGNTEMQSSQNYILKRDSYYLAIQGVEEVRAQLLQNLDEGKEIVNVVAKSALDTSQIGESNIKRFYITGTLRDMENGETGTTVKNTPNFIDFHLPGFGLGATAPMEIAVLKIEITSKVEVGSKSSYSEVMAGIYMPVAKE